MACCALEACADPECPVCSVNRRFEVEACPRDCRLVLGHPGPCQVTTRKAKAERAEFKPAKALPDLSAPRAASTALAFKKRHREGPVRQQRAS